MWAKVKVTYSGLKMLKTVITEVTFFLSGFSFMNIHNSQNNREKGGEGYLFNSWGTNVFEQIIYWEVVLKERTNDQIVPMWERGFINDKCIFQ